MNLGTRADRPIGMHPCRSWFDVEFESEKLKHLSLEYQKCPVHVAVLNGQVKIMTLIAKSGVHMLEQKDGYGLAPWRIALHNTHKDPIKNLNQKDVARFLLAKAFGGRVPISNDSFGCNVSIHLYYKIKSWCDRAKDRVLFVYGISKSSYKRRPQAKGGLLGNTVLIDGFNNNFKESPNSYERLRNKYKFYYFIDDDDKDK